MNAPTPSRLQRAVNWAWAKTHPKQARQLARKERLKSGKRFAVLKNGPKLGLSTFGLSPSAGEKMYCSLAQLRDICRRQSEDNPYFKRFLQMLQVHIVGSEGFRFTSKAVTKRGKPDRMARMLVEDSFTEWAERGNCDVTGQYSLVDICNLVVTSVARDGDILVREVFGYKNRWGYALQILEGDQLDINLNKDFPDGRRIRMGVEMDEFNKPLAYHIFTEHPGDRTVMFGSNQYERIPADEMMLIHLPWRVGQVRGLPWAHASLLDLFQIAGYREAELFASRVAASKMFVYEHDPEIEPEEDDDGNILDDGEFVEELEPGASGITPYGYKVRELNLNHPHDNFGDFTKAGLRGASSGMGVNYHSIGNDLEGVNFSSIRQGVLEDRDVWKYLQKWLESWFLTRITRSQIRMSLLTGEIPLPFTELNRLKKFEFQGRRWEWIDPLKDEKAVSEGISNCTRSPFRIIRERGQNPDEVIDDLIEFEIRVAEARKRRAESQQKQEGTNATDPDEETDPETGSADS